MLMSLYTLSECLTKPLQNQMPYPEALYDPSGSVHPCSSQNPWKNKSALHVKHGPNRFSIFPCELQELAAGMQDGWQSVCQVCLACLPDVDI
jgi:hypothetical protein